VGGARRFGTCQRCFKVSGYPLFARSFWKYSEKKMVVLSVE
jgi:hypothetical protein